tara:strand:- start:2085 stop:4880 length:2796 start_codon:yes stop_codon:yes gene_type:complete
MNKKEINNMICFALFIVLVILLICVFNHETDIIEGNDNKATLKELKISDVKQFTFNSKTLNYTLAPNAGIRKVNVTAQASNKNDKVIITQGSNSVEKTEKHINHGVILDSDKNTTFDITVKAKEDNTEKTYKIVILQEDGIALLNKLVITGIVDKSFALEYGKFEYKLSVKSNLEKIMLTATLENSSDELRIGDIKQTHKVARAIYLNADNKLTQIPIRVIHKKGETTEISRTYTLNFLPVRGEITSPSSTENKNEDEDEDEDVYARLIKEDGREEKIFGSILEKGDTLQLVIPKKSQSDGKDPPPPECGVFRLGEVDRKSVISYSSKDQIYFCSYKIQEEDLEIVNASDSTTVEYSYKKLREDMDAEFLKGKMKDKEGKEITFRPNKNHGKTVTFKFKLPIEMLDIKGKEREFDDAFIKDMAVILGIDMDRITIINKESGSVIVTTAVAPNQSGISIQLYNIDAKMKGFLTLTNLNNKIPSIPKTLSASASFSTKEMKMIDEIKKEKITKIDNYISVLKEISNLAKNDDVFNSSVKEIYPEYIPIKDMNKYNGEPIICRNKAIKNCSLKYEINWNIVLAVSCLIVEEKNDSSSNLIEGFSKKHNIYLLDVRNILDKIKDIPSKKLLNEFKKVLVWKRVDHKGDMGNEGTIQYENGAWVEKINDTTKKLKDMNKKGYSILGKINNRVGKKQNILSILNVLLKENPLDDIASLQLAMHLFFEQPLYIRDSKYVLPNGYLNDDIKIIQSTREKLIKLGALPELDCYNGVGAQYQGEVNTWIDKGGIIHNCAHWDSENIPIGKKIKKGIIEDYNIGDIGKAHPKFLKGGKFHNLVKENHCRNPDPLGKTGEKPWCYTEKPGVRWAQCNIRQCTKNQIPKKGLNQKDKKCAPVIDEEKILLKKKIKIINSILRKENEILDKKIIRLYKTVENTQE